MTRTINPPPAHRLYLISSHCEIRDDRWSITLQDEGDNSIDRVALMRALWADDAPNGRRPFA